jgi:tetratricopeptide (TPR) repeat protein
LAIAVGFTALLNVLILATLVFTEWIPLEQVVGGYGVVAVSWLVGWWRSSACLSGELSPHQDTKESSTETETVGLASELGEQLFREAQQVYLQGDWVAAEQLLLKLLKLEMRDAEARLMLATLWRRQGRHREALRQLDKLSRLEAAEPWKFEIARERQENAAALENTGNTTTNADPPTLTTEDPGAADGQSSVTETSEASRRLAA